MRTNAHSRLTSSEAEKPSWGEILIHLLALGFVNVGGPMTQIKRMSNHMVESQRWLSQERLLRILSFCRMLPGPEDLQLAIYVGYLKRKIQGGLLTGLIFILPGAVLMTLLASLYSNYARLPRMSSALFILRPAVLGVIAAGAIKLGAAAIRNFFLATILALSFAALSLSKINLIPILLLAGLLNLLFSQAQKKAVHAGVFIPWLLVFAFPFVHPHWLRITWLFLKTGLFSFGGAYATLAFLQQGAVEGYHWITGAQLLDAVALGLATPGPFVLFSTFIGYLVGGIRGAILATFFVLLPSFVLVSGAARQMEKLRQNAAIQAFVAGVSAAAIGIIIAVSLAIAPWALIDKFNVGIAVTAFLATVLLKVDGALVACLAMLGGIGYAFFHPYF